MGERRRGPLERLLGDALEKDDPVPSHLIEASAALFDLIDPEQSLAALVEAEGAAVRSASARQQTHRWEPDIELSLQTTASDTMIGLIGFIEGVDPIRVVVERTGGEEIEAELAHGSFDVRIERGGHFRIVVMTEDRRLVTAWIRGEDQPR